MGSRTPRVEMDRAGVDGKEFSFRVHRGGNIVLIPGEAFGKGERAKCRRAIKALADMCTDKSSTSWVSPLQAACLKCLHLDALDFEAKTGLYAK